MEAEIVQKLQAQDEKLDRIYRSVESTRRYLLWTLVGSVVMFVLPLIGLVVAVPFLLSTLGSAYGL